MQKGYLYEKERYRYQKTVDDYIVDVGWEAWTGNILHARQILIFLMDKYIKDIGPDGKEIENGWKENPLNEGVEKIKSFPSEEGEDWSYGRYGDGQY